MDPNGAANPVDLVRSAILTACGAAGVSPEALRACVIGTPGVLDPRTGDLGLAVNLPAWHEGVLAALRDDLGRPVTIENDVNLAAMAERAVGAARGADDSVLVWIGVGLGLATILGGRLHRGVGGAAGELGYLPVPGEPGRARRRGWPGRWHHPGRPGSRRGGPDLPGPPAGGSDRGQRRTSAARGDPGRGRSGSSLAARIRGQHRLKIRGNAADRGGHRRKHDHLCCSRTMGA